MKIDDVEFVASCREVLEELRKQLRINGIKYFEKEPFISGNNLMVQCPYHGEGKESKPSAGIRMSDGVLHCFACNETHTLPEVISHCFGRYDFSGYGWDWLQRNFKDFYSDAGMEQLKLKMPAAQKRRENKYVSEEELDSYRYECSYWEKRGIVDDEIIELFDLGYDSTRRCVTFPVRNIDGNTLFVARRSVKSKFFQYPKGVTKPLYGIYELMTLKSVKYVIVCESMIDCILLWQYGHPAAALNGLGNAFQTKQLTELPYRHIILGLDNDKAGQEAEEKLIKYVKGHVLSKIKFPKGIKDFGECTKLQLINILDWETVLWK